MVLCTIVLLNGPRILPKHPGMEILTTGCPFLLMLRLISSGGNNMFDSCPIRREPVHLTLYSDASLEGWGGTDEVTHVGGRWTEAEMPYHINALELQVAYLTLQALGVPHKNVHLRLMLDNPTATMYINKMGGTHSVVCNLVAKAIWERAILRNVRLSAAYIPGSQNKIADFKSRHFDENTEWSLSPVLFARLSQVFYIPWVDLFASRLNRQVVLEA